jgi:hypothetical protein
MKIILRLAVIALTFAGSMLMTQKAHSYAYNPWTGMTGEGILGVTPFVYAPTLNPFSLGADLYVNYGIFNNLDVFVDLAEVTIVPKFGYVFSSGMIRYDLGGNNILALQASQTFIAPQYHFFWENDMLALEANVYASFLYSSFGTPTIGAYLAPVWKIVKDFVYLYLEVDPAYTIKGSFALNLVPGLWFGFGNAGQVSIGVTLPNLTGGVGLAPAINLWYYISFDLKPKK